MTVQHVIQLDKVEVGNAVLTVMPGVYYEVTAITDENPLGVGGSRRIVLHLAHGFRVAGRPTDWVKVLL
jgi:hypothetical protein